MVYKTSHSEISGGGFQNSLVAGLHFNGRIDAAILGPLSAGFVCRAKEVILSGEGEGGNSNCFDRHLHKHFSLQDKFLQNNPGDFAYAFLVWN